MQYYVCARPELPTCL